MMIFNTKIPSYKDLKAFIFSLFVIITFCAIACKKDVSQSVNNIARPHRIISLAPNLTEILFALGAGDRVIGVTSFCNYPEAAKSKEKIGDTIHPDLERIISLKPDLVLVSTSSQLEELTGKLESLGIRVYITNPRSVRDVVKTIRDIGTVIDAPAQAKVVADNLDKRIDAVETLAKNKTKPSVLYILNLSPLITAGKNTFINNMIELAGGESISRDQSADYPQFSKETAIARAPKVIVIPNHIKSEDVREELSGIFINRTARIVTINPDLTERPGPRIVDGMEQLSKALISKD